MKKILLMVTMLNMCIAYGDLIYDDNQVHTLDFVYESGWVDVLASTTVNVVDGADLRLGLGENSVAYITSGNIKAMVTGGASAAYITGGDFRNSGDYYFTGDSVVHVDGGLWSTSVSVGANASMIFNGSDFMHTIDDFGYYHIDGILESGDVLDNFRVYVGPDAFIQFVPEPATLAMLALGGVLIRRRRFTRSH